MSAEYQPSIGQVSVEYHSIHGRYIDRHLVDTVRWSSSDWHMHRLILSWYVCRVLAQYRPSISQVSVKYWLIYDQYINRVSVDMSVEYCWVATYMLIHIQPIFDWYTTDWVPIYWLILGRYSADILTECRSIYRSLVSADTTYSKHDPQILPEIHVASWKCESNTVQFACELSRQGE